MMATPKPMTWQDWHEINPALFPLPLELRESQSGSISVLLQKIPLELVRDANRCPNPWRELASMNFIAYYRSLFLSCASVETAWRVLASCGWGGTTSANHKKVFAVRRNESGKKAETQRIGKRIAAAMLRYDSNFLTKLARESGAAENILGLEVLIKELHATSKRPLRGGGKEYAKSQLLQRYPIQILLAANWIRHGQSNGQGWLFYTNQALANLFSLLDWAGFKVIGEDISAEQVEQICVRLGLKKADDKFLVISDTRQDDKAGVIRLNYFPPKKARVEFPKDALEMRTPIKLGQHILYPGISPARIQGNAAKVVGR